MAVPRPVARGIAGSHQLVRGGFRLFARRDIGKRWIQISTFEGSTTQPDNLPINASSADAEGPDAKFEVLGAPYSLLSTSLSASQTLYTRRGTLVGLSGKAENVISTLSTLEPFRRALLGIPFFYQKITSASPVTALLSTKSPLTSFTVVHLDGTIDWMVAQRRAVLAWTGQTLSITPTLNTQLTVGYWGNSRIAGRGLVALVGNGQIYELVLGPGETYIAHPSNVLAYTISKQPPAPYRFRSSTLRLEVPGVRGLARFLPDVRFFREVQRSETWRVFSNFMRWLRTVSRRTIFGDRLFMHFTGPTTILLQTRAARISDVLSAREVNEVADTPAGSVEDAIQLDVRREAAERELLKKAAAPTASVPTMSTATVGGDGNVRFQEGLGSSAR